MDYEPNPSGIITADQAFNMANKSSDALVGGIDKGMGIADQVQTVQLRKQQIQQQMQTNRENMINHAGQTMFDLASADPDEKKGPLWKAKSQYLQQGLTQMGVPYDSDLMDSYLKDDTHSQKMSTALAQWSNSSLPNDQRAQALSQISHMLSDPTMIEKAPDVLEKEVQSRIQMQYKGNNQLVQGAQKIANDASTIAVQHDKNNQFANEAKGLLDNYGNFKTGISDAAIKESLTKFFSNGVPRAFTIQMLNQSTGIPDRIRNAIQKASEGKSFQLDQRSDMQSALNIGLKAADEAKYEALKPKWNAYNGYIQRAKVLGQDDLVNSNNFPQWDDISSREQKKGWNPDTFQYEKDQDQGNTPPPKKGKSTFGAAGTTTDQTKTPAGAQISGKYQGGYDPTKDPNLKQAIAQGTSLDLINATLKSKNLGTMPNSDYNRIKLMMKAKGQVE